MRRFARLPRAAWSGLTRAAGVALVAAATAAGWTARELVRFGPGVAAGGCLVYGATYVHPAAPWLVAGALLLILDRKAP